jgi:hypothetical protein
LFLFIFAVISHCAIVFPCFVLSNLPRKVLKQGDQIGRNGRISPMGYCLLWDLFDNYRSSPYFGAPFSCSCGFALLLAKTGWATLRPFFQKLIWSPCRQALFAHENFFSSFSNEWQHKVQQ